MEIKIESVSNGWIVRSLELDGADAVFLDLEELLTAVYMKMSQDWHVGDRVRVERVEGR